LAASRLLAFFARFFDLNPFAHRAVFTAPVLKALSVDKSELVLVLAVLAADDFRFGEKNPFAAFGLNPFV
jgi:hypothetical protein